MKRPPLIDLCFYCESDFDEFLEINPDLADLTRIQDEHGSFHTFFRCRNAPSSMNPIMRGEKRIGYFNPLPEEIAFQIESVWKNPQLN